MKLYDRFEEPNSTELISTRCYRRNSQTEKLTGEVLSEHKLTIFINEQPAMRLVCTPRDLAALVLGRMLTEGFIRSVADVKMLSICDKGLEAHVFLEDTAPLRQAAVDEVPSCCTDNHILLSPAVTIKEPVTFPADIWRAEDIYALAEIFEKRFPLYSATRSVHSCMLFHGSNMLFMCEDIGRHNALDKVIGLALQQNIDLSRTGVYTSGRVPLDMMKKCVTAGIPLLVSKTRPTKEAIDLAAKHQVTLIGSAGRESFLLYEA